MRNLLQETEVFSGFSVDAPPTAPVARSSFFSDSTAVGAQYNQQLVAEAAAEERKAKTNFWDGFQKARKQSHGWLFEESLAPRDLYDPNYVHDMEKHKAMLKAAGALPEHYQYFNQPILSQRHAEILIERYQESRANDQYLADMGLAGGLAVGLAAEVVNPVNLAASLMTGGAAYAYHAYKVGKLVKNGMAMAKAVEQANNASRLAMVAKGAAFGAGEAMATEYLLKDNKPTWVIDDVWNAGIVGAGFGGGGAYIGALLKANSTKHLGSADLGRENQIIHQIGESMEIKTIKEDVERGEYVVHPDIERIINDPAQTNPVSEITRLANDAETRIKKIEEEITKRETELAAIDAGMPTQKTSLVGEAAQLKDPRTAGGVKTDYTKYLHGEVQTKLNDLKPGEVFSDLTAGPTKKTEGKDVREANVQRKAGVEELARTLMKEFLPDQKLYLTTTSGAMQKNATKGKYGVTARLSDDVIQISLNRNHMRDNSAYATLAHEIGHQVLNTNFLRAPASVRRGIYEEYQKYLTEVRNMKDGQEVAHTRFTAEDAEKTKLVSKDPALELSRRYKKDYIFSFDEYMAERFAKHVEQKGDLSLPEQVRAYFDAMVEKIKALFGKVEGYLAPGTTVEKFFDDIRAGKYRDAVKKTDAELKAEAENIRKELDELRGQLGLEQENAAAYDKFLRSDTAGVLANAIQSPETVMGNVRFDISSSMGTSPNPIVRRFGFLTVTEPVGFKGRQVQSMTAEESQKILSRQMETAYYRSFTPLYEQWLSKQKLSGADWFNARRIFNEEVGMVRLGLAVNPSPEAVKMAKAYGDIMVEYNSHINEIGKLDGRPLGGLRKEPLPDDPDYFSRLHDMHKWNEAMEKYGPDNVQQFFKGALMSANPNLTDKLADRIAKTYMKKVQGMKLEEFGSFDRAFSGNDLDELKVILKDQGILTDDEIDTVVFQLKANTGKDKDAPVNSRMKRRAMLDTSYTLDVGGEKITMADFININAEEVFQTYNRQMSGAIAMARVGIRTKADFERMLMQFKDSASAIPGYYGSYRMKTDMENMEFVYKKIVGVPINPDTWYTQAAGMFQKLNVARLMNQMGVVQFQELGNAIGQMGLKTVMKAVPSFRDLIRDAKTGQLPDKVLDDMERMLGFGTDILKGHNVDERWLEDRGGFISNNGNKVWNTVDSALNKAVNTTMMISGFRHINVGLHRMLTRAIPQKFFDAAKGSDNAIKAEFREMMGMTDDMYKRVLSQFDQHAKEKRGALFGRIITDINMENWTDPEAAAAFQLGVFRWARRMVQENDIGSMHRVMGHWAVQPLLQFRGFTINAWSKSTLWGIHNMNTEVMLSVLYGTMLSSMVYIGRIYANSIGRSDAEEYREKYLRPEMILINGASRTTQASLIPGSLDTFVSPLFGTQWFSESRSTGLSASFLDARSTPTGGVLDALVSMPSAIHGIASDDKDVSEATIRKRLSLLPFQNAMFVQQGLNLLASELAE